MAKHAMLGITVAMLLFLACGALACSVNLSNEKTELRSNTNGYATSISAQLNSPIDIMTSFTVNSLSGSDCNGNLQAKETIFRYNTNTGSWEQFRTTSTKSQGIGVGDFVFIWNDEFNISSSSNYTRYRVDATVLDNNGNTLDTDSAYVDVQNNTCSGIKINTSTITMNENSSATRTFTIENNTNTAFNISSLGVLFTNTLITSGSANYNNLVNPYSSTNLSLALNSGNVSGDTTVTGTISLSGNLGSTFCSSSMIGQKNFDVTVQENGTNNNNNNNPSSVSDCDDLSLVVNDFYVNENSTTQQPFYLKNNGLLRFEITEVQLTSNGLALSNYFNEKYAFNGELADIVVNAVGPNVTENKTYNNSIKVRGVFSDGTTCSFSNIKDANFNVIVKNTSIASFTSCTNLAITAPSVVNAENFGSIPFTVTNGTSKNAVVYVESSLDVTPTIIALPPNSSISREITFQINTPSEQVVFRPIIDGCNLQSTTVLVKNNAAGNMSNLTMSAKAQNDGDILRVIVEIKNSSSKIFSGTLTTSAPAGWMDDSRAFTVAPGNNTIEIDLVRGNNQRTGSGSVTFSSNGEQISANLNSNNGSLAGFFTLGEIAGGIGLIVLILIILIVLAVILSRDSGSPKETNQVDDWRRHGHASKVAQESKPAVANKTSSTQTTETSSTLEISRTVGTPTKTVETTTDIQN